MNPTADEIRELCAAGICLRFRPDGSLLSAEPDASAERRALTATERTRLRRARLAAANETASVSLEGENETMKRNETDETKSVSPPSPPPLSPTPPIPAPTPAGGARERTREAEADFQAACSVDLDLTASPELRQAWTEWQTYRQRRHKATGTAKLPWTAQAAKLSASQITRNAETHGTQIITDRIASAIAGNWQGLNFDTLKTNGHAPNQPPSSRFPATSTAAAKNRPPDGHGRPKATAFDV